MQRNHEIGKNGGSDPIRVIDIHTKTTKPLRRAKNNRVPPKDMTQQSYSFLITKLFPS